MAIGEGSTTDPFLKGHFAQKGLCLVFGVWTEVQLFTIRDS
jgi:hypothetical protein